MVAKWVALAILGLLVIAAIPIALTWIWTIGKVFVAAVLLFLMVAGLIALVIKAIDYEIQIKKQNEKDDEE